MSDDIARDFELKPVIIGIIISVVCILIGMSTGIGFISILGVIVGSVVAGFTSQKSTKMALIYGAIIGIISSFLAFTIFSIVAFIILGLFGGLIGKVIQNNIT